MFDPIAPDGFDSFDVEDFAPLGTDGSLRASNTRFAVSWGSWGVGKVDPADYGLSLIRADEDEAGDDGTPVWFDYLTLAEATRLRDALTAALDATTAHLSGSFVCPDDPRALDA